MLRETPIFGALGKIWLGRNFDPAFKVRGYERTDGEFVAAYRSLGGVYSRRETDTTKAQAAWISSRIGAGPLRILEIGPGNGQLGRGLGALGHRVWGLNLAPPGLSRGCGVIGVAERLPFAGKSIDVVVMAHVIEHARSLTKTFVELARVCRRRVLLVTPRQRPCRFTFDYHLHFFHSVGHLASHIPGGSAVGEVIDHDLCLEWRVGPE